MCVVDGHRVRPTTTGGDAHEIDGVPWQPIVVIESIFSELHRLPVADTAGDPDRQVRHVDVDAVGKLARDGAPFTTPTPDHDAATARTSSRKCRRVGRR